MSVTDQDRRAWVDHPVTQEFLKKLEESRQETLESWAREAYIGDSADQSAMMNAKALGGINVLDQVLESIQAMKEASND